MSEEREIGVRLATPDDARAIRRLLLSTYGDGYPFPERLDESTIARGIVEATTLYGVAETHARDMIGLAALEPRGSHGLFEYSRATVADGFRGTGLLASLGGLLIRQHAPRHGARFVTGYVVTSHVYAQRFGRSFGFATTGLLLGGLPSQWVPSGFSRERQPISELLMALRVARNEPVRDVALAGPDGDRALRALAALGVPARRGRGKPGELGAHFERNKAHGLVQLRFATGAPPRRLHPGFVEGLEAAGTAILWADVPIDHARAPFVVDRLRELGLGFAAYLPAAGVHGEDVLRFQRYLHDVPLDFDAIQVIDEARALKDDVIADAVGVVRA